MNTTVRNCLSKADKTKLDKITKACCEYYELTEKELMQTNSRSVTKVRQYACYLLHINIPTLSDRAMAEIFGKAKSTIQYGLETIEAHSRVYADTHTALQKIAEIANKESAPEQTIIIG